MVAFHARDRGVDDFDVGAVLFGDTFAYALDSGLAGFGVSYDSTFGYVFAASFELRFDENDGFALPGVIWLAERGKDSGEDQCGGDERDVHRQEGWLDW